MRVIEAHAGEIMGTRLYLTIAAIVAFLYALAFLLIPVQASLFFSSFAEPRATRVIALPLGSESGRQ